MYSWQYMFELVLRTFIVLSDIVFAGSLMLSKTTNTTCIQSPDPTKKILALQMCGNGIVEPGEECDPGSGITSSCCDSSTCKLVSGATCDPASSTCCTQTCQYAPSTQVCRPSRDAACDMPEMCTGSSANCPEDKTQPNGSLFVLKGVGILF